VVLNLSTGDSNKLDLGFLQPGVYTFAVTGNGDLVDSTFQTNADGSLFAQAAGAYSFANPGAPYPALFGGDGINHFVGGGANYDFAASGLSAFAFAGPMTTDTTNPNDIRFGAVVGTFSSSPSREDWFPIGTGRRVTVSGVGAHLYLAVNDTYSANNHGAYTVTYSSTPVSNIR
jgi:hypothetical protein